MKRVRVITYAWGEAYVDDMLNYGLAALAAPGNLPALATEFRCEFVLVTESRLFPRVEAHPAFRRVRGICAARLIAIDDLLAAPLYGLSLSYAAYRAFEDLGEEVAEIALVYFNSDWILADGSYRSLIPHIRAGKRIVVAPSYCVVTERALPKIRARLSEGGSVLAIPHREMAQLAIRYRHNTIRGKTVNRPVLHMEVMEQFYWRVDSRTLLAHQMPVGIVCLSPERFIAKPEAFWDYGTISELCPTATPVVMGDSDDFLMIELRGEETYAEGLRPGAPDLAAAGRFLATFATKDHLDYGRHQLCLHSGDLPPGIDEARARLREVLERVYAEIPGPIDHRAHSFWWPQERLFDIARREYGSREVVREWRWGFRASPYTNMIRAEMDRFDRALDSGARQPSDAEGFITDLGASIGQLEGLFHGDLNSLRKALQTRSLRWRQRSARVQRGPAAPAQGAKRVLGWLRGVVNAPHVLHPDRLVAADLIDELRREQTSSANTVLVSSRGHDLAERVFELLGGAFSHQTAEDALTAEPARGVKLLVCDLAPGDLESFRPILRRYLPVMADGGKILLFHPARRGKLALDPGAMLGAFPPTDELTVRFAGSRWIHLATGVYDRVPRKLPRLALAGFNLAPALALVVAAPLVLAASLSARLAGGRDAMRVPESCASMLLSMPVTPGVREELEGW